MTDTTTANPWTDEDRALERRLTEIIGTDIVLRQPPRNIAREVLIALAPRVAELQRAAKVEALEAFSQELHDRADNLKGSRKNEAWFCSDRALNRADEIGRGERD